MDDLKSLLERLDARMREGAPDNEGFTSTEFASANGLSVATALRRIREMCKRGMVQPCQVKRANLHDISKQVPGYRSVTP